MREAHNLEAYVEWFNRLSYLVAAEILRHDNKKARIKALEFFIQVGHECQQQHNYNSLMAIVSALNFASVGRLKKTWDKLPSKYHQLYQQLEVRRRTRIISCSLIYNVASLSCSESLFLVVDP